MRHFLRVLAIFYLIGGILHLMDILSLRLNFSEIPVGWKFWILYLFIGDTAAAVLLWKHSRFGEYLFLGIAISQLIAYHFFENYFGNQIFLIAFHIASLSTYSVLKFRHIKSIQ